MVTTDMKVGKAVTCGHCGRVKAPRGRSVADIMWDSYCQGWKPDGSGCIGYTEEPRVGDLWPGETEREFGFAFSLDGTRDAKGCDLPGCGAEAVSTCDNCDRAFCEDHGHRGGDRLRGEVLTAYPALCDICREFGR